MEIVYADPRIVVAVKPAGVLSTDEPGGMPQLLRQELFCIGRRAGSGGAGRKGGPGRSAGRG